MNPCGTLSNHIETIAESKCSLKRKEEEEEGEGGKDKGEERRRVKGR
jgi:hypothetical protein